jgi:hypothetical protein
VKKDKKMAAELAAKILKATKGSSNSVTLFRELNEEILKAIQEKPLRTGTD